MQTAPGRFHIEDYDAMGGVRGVIARRLELRHGERILDVGTGTGNFARALAGAADVRVHGIDIVARYTRRAAELADRAGLADRCTFEHVELDALAVTRFDRATTFLGLCELLKRRSALDALAALAARAPRIAIIDHCVEDAANEPQRLALEINEALGYRYLSAAALRAAAGAAGLVVERTWAIHSGRPALGVAGACEYVAAEAAYSAFDGSARVAAIDVWHAFEARITDAGGIEPDAVLRVFELAVRA